MLRLLAWLPLALSLSIFAADKPPAFSSSKYDKDIAAFEAADQANPPPRDAVLLSGASTFRRWTKAADALQGYPIINRGFGGSKTAEVLGYMDRITLPYHPRVVVFHCGSNDLNGGDTAEAVAGRVREYLTRLRKDNPACAFILLSTTHAPSRRKAWEKMRQADALFRQLAQAEPGVTYLDINPALNLPDGEPRPGVYAADALHPSDLGYDGITALLRPVLEKAWKDTAPAFAK
jgi:lysophospholipase L1-like esterase